MSWKAWSDLGYGFDLCNGDNLLQIAKFLSDHCGCEECYDELSECQSVEEMNGTVLNMPAEYMIASYINETEGLTVVAGYTQDDYDNPGKIGVYPSLPWNMNEKDKALTKESVNEIFAKYKAELGLDMERENGSFEMEYSG